MKLNPLADEPFKMSDPAGKLHAALNAKIQKLRSDAAAHEGLVASLASTPADQLSPSHVARAKQLAYDDLDILRRELEIRKLLAADWFLLRTAERRAEAERAQVAMDRCREELTEKLRSIGYFEPHPSGQATVNNDFYFRHPEFAHRKAWYDASFNSCHSTDDQQLNGQVMKEITQAMDTARTRLMRV